MAAITVRRVWKEYGQQVVLENLNLQLNDHEFVTIVGPSGSGKTTFLRMLLGVDGPTRGEITIDGVALADEPRADRGIVFQRYSLFPHLTVLDNVLVGLEMKQSRSFGYLIGRPRRSARARAQARLEEVGLGAARDT